MVYCLFVFVCSLVWEFTSLSRIFHSYVDVTIYRFWLLLGTYDHWAVRILMHATPTVTRDIRLYWSSPRTRDTHTYITCFNNWGLSRLRFEQVHPAFRMRLGERSNRLRHSCGVVYCKTEFIWHQYKWRINICISELEQLANGKTIIAVRLPIYLSPTLLSKTFGLSQPLLFVLWFTKMINVRLT